MQQVQQQPSLNDLPLAPSIIAETAILNVRESNERYKVFDLQELFKSMAPVLCEHAEKTYASSKEFRHNVKNSRKDQRITLLLYMQSWALTLFKNKLAKPVYKPQLTEPLFQSNKKY